MKVMSGASELEAFCKQVIDENPAAVEDYKKGNEKSLHYIIGQVMKKTRGQAAPSVVHDTLKKLLK
jgi:aspartyl-tRNA(Asn)/glutamyl-tRNA(Gln) amidotransferase subunit B